MKKVIGFSLWGSKEIYLKGALVNIELANQFYPEWNIIFFMAPDVPEMIVNQIQSAPNTSVIKGTEKPGHLYALRRFQVLELSHAALAIFRDVDSRITRREVDAVTEWLNSEKTIHIMRDHPLHDDLILAGMWGIKRSATANLSTLIEEYVKQKGFAGSEERIAYGFDQEFLAEVIFPLFQKEALIHDEFYGGQPFPAPRKGLQFVGQVYDENEYTNLWHCEKLSEHLMQQQVAGVLGLPIRIQRRLKTILFAGDQRIADQTDESYQL